MRRAPSLALLIAIASSGAHAQSTQANEFWPDLQIEYRFDDRTKAIVLGSYNRDRDSGSVYQAEVGYTLDHRFADFFSGRVGYRHGFATDGGDFYENRLLAEQTFRMALPSRVMVDFRTREDFRWLNTGFSVRLRERIQVQRETTIGDYTFRPYASTELYFDTRYGQFSRYRLIVGTNFPIGPRFSIEPYLAHQVDVVPSSKIVDALGLTLTVSF